MVEEVCCDERACSSASGAGWETGAVSSDWQALHRLLRDQVGAVTLSWETLDELVGGLPPSALKHRAWWSGDRSHVNAWKSAGFRLGAVHLGVSVGFQPDEDAHVVTTAPAFSPDGSEADNLAASDVVLVTCVKTKRADPSAAKDLYISPLFRRQRKYAEQTGKPWFILSAEHGLVAPEEWLAPYERYLPDTPSEYRDAWGRWVVARLELLLGPLRGLALEVHAGADYAHAIAEPVHQAGARLMLPLEGLSQGQRLHWYAARTPNVPQQRNVADVEIDASADVDVDELVTHYLYALRDSSSARTVPDLLASDRTPLQQAGLYSWWVDAAGAEELTQALGHPIGAGLIYAGQAGATRWPSGRRSANTLWGRLVGMHLGRKHEFSTFRRTLAALLKPRGGSGDVDEAALTSWMGEHLCVIAAPSSDPDVLGKVEHEVLQRLDPPLNLDGMPATLVRTELKRARRGLGGRNSP